jgi:type VI secretion system protein ImpH
MTASPLFKLLTREPGSFDAATALRIAEAEAASRGLPALVRATPSAALEPLAVARVSSGETAVFAETHVIGLIGPLSPLPPAYTEIAARDTRRRSGALSAFFDLFSDRLTWLFVAATEKYDLPARLRWSGSGENTILTALRALIGFATPGMAERSPLPGDDTLRYAGLYAQRTRNAEGLRALAATELGLPVRVLQFHQRWRDVPVTEQSRMDGRAMVGETAMAGSHVPDRASQCRLVIGPVRYADFLSLEQGQPRLERLRKLVRLYLGPVLDYDIQIVLDRRDVPETQLGGDALPVRLGWNVWARSEPATRDSDEMIIGSAA